MSYMDVYKSWLDSEYIDDGTKAELKRLRAMQKKSRIVFIRI